MKTHEKEINGNVETKALRAEINGSCRGDDAEMNHQGTNTISGSCGTRNK